MPEPNSIDYSKWTGIKAEIAKQCDKDHNGKLEKTTKYDEISIFNQQYEEIGKKYDDYFIAKTDAIHDYNADIIKTKGQHDLLTINKVKKPVKLSANSDIRTDYDWSEEEFSKVLDQMLNAPRYRGKFKNSVLQGKAKAFIEAGKKYHVDPRILVAIAMCESSRGTSELAMKNNNIGGLIINGKYHNFENIEASIDSIAKTMESRCEEGYTTPKSIAYSGRYCKKWAAPNWLSDVKWYLGCFDKFYKYDNVQS